MMEWWFAASILSVPVGALVAWLWIRSMNRDHAARVERCRDQEKKP